MGNMYSDSIYQWNVFVGCLHSCIYCKRSFQAQMKRQLHNCKDCYDFKPHFHEERLNINFNLSKYETKGDQFIWVASSSDIVFAEEEWVLKILDKIDQYPNRTFFIQTKNPYFFEKYEIPENVLFGITLETNRNYTDISKAPFPVDRYYLFKRYWYRNLVVTIEPILDFDLNDFVYWIKEINPERVYVGYNTKGTRLPEPSLSKTLQLIEELKKFTKVKPKLLRERWVA